MAPVSGPRFRGHIALTGEGISSIISYLPASQKTHWHNAGICLGETRTDTLNCLDLCYSFKVLCQAEYGGTRQLHNAAKNYAHNYGLSARLHQNRRIPYKRALRNLVVLMFSHYVNHLECTGSLEGHRTLMVHECLFVVAALGRYHHWQRQVSHQDRDTDDWTKVPVVPKDDFRHKYSPALTLLGNAKTRHMLTQNCSDAALTMFTFVGGSSVICRQRGEHPPLKRGLSSFTTKNMRS